jgi:hypothetical protein
MSKHVPTFNMLSNKKMIDDIEATKRNFINSRPKMLINPFVSNKAELDYNLGYSNNQTGENLLEGGRHYSSHPLPVKNNLILNHPDALITRGPPLVNEHRRGGAFLLHNPPPNKLGSKGSILYGGRYTDSSSSSDSDSDSSSSSDSSSDSDSDSDIEGAGLYDDVIKPTGKAIYNVGKATGKAVYGVGKEIFNDVVVPVGKEIIKDKIKKTLGGGQKPNKKSLIEIAQQMYPEIDFNKLSNEKIKAYLEGKITDDDINDDIKGGKTTSKGSNKGGKIKKIVGTKRGEKVRGDIIAEYMKKHNVKLGEASKMVKKLGLY